MNYKKINNSDLDIETNELDDNQFSVIDLETSNLEVENNNLENNDLEVENNNLEVENNDLVNYNLEVENKDLVNNNNLELENNDLEEENNPICRICLDNNDMNDLIAPCRCSGTSKYVHRKCINHWRILNIENQFFNQCNECQFNYIIQENINNYHCSKSIFQFFSKNIFLTFFLILGLIELLYRIYETYNVTINISILDNITLTNSYYLLSIMTVLSFFTLLLLIHEIYIYHFIVFDIKSYCQGYAGIGIIRFILLYLLNIFIYFEIPIIGMILSTLIIQIISKHITNTIYNNNILLDNYILDLNNRPELLN